MSESREAQLALIAAKVMTVHLADFERLMQTCINCEAFDETRAICNKNARTPPPRIIAFGCNAFEERTPF